MADWQRFRTVEAVLSAELAKPYLPGSADCFMLGCRVTDALDPSLGLETLYGESYSTLKGAARALRRRGFASIADLFGTHLVRVAPAAAQLGDLAVVRFPDGGEHVAICLGSRFRTKTAAGAVDRPLADVLAAFAVGR